MGRVFALLSLAALTLLASGADAAPAGGPAPDLAACAAAIVRQDDDPPPGAPVAIPPAFADIIRAGPTSMAIASQTGKTLCVSMIWTDTVKDMTWLQEGRLLGFAHDGWENFGYRVIDRAADGRAIETGERPLMSPNGTRFASLQLSDEGWGGLEGFGVWDIGADATIPIKSQGTGEDGVTPDLFVNNYGDWKLAGWRGNDCIDIRHIPYDPNSADQLGQPVRPFFSHEANGWDIREGTCG